MGSDHRRWNTDNYILLGDPQILKEKARKFSADQKADFPEMFEGKVDAFPFELRYAAPFEKPFRELKRLQGTAAEAAGRRDEFRGYILIDVSSWLEHREEVYFQLSLLYLVDQNEDWKYIFLVNDQNKRLSKELAGTILEAFFRENILCTVIEWEEEHTAKERIHSLCRKLDVVLSTDAEELLLDLMEQDFSETIISAMVNEASFRFGRRISEHTLIRYMTQNNAIRYMLKTKDYDRLVNNMEQRKEKWNVEKKAV